MQEGHPIDEFMKQQTSMAPVPYDPALWAGMEGKLAANGLLKSVVWWKAWAWSLVLVPIIGVSLMALVSYKAKVLPEISALAWASPNKIEVIVPITHVAQAVMKGTAGPNALPTGQPQAAEVKVNSVFVAPVSVSSQEKEAPAAPSRKPSLEGLPTNDATPLSKIPILKTQTKPLAFINLPPKKRPKLKVERVPEIKALTPWFVEGGVKLGESYRVLMSDGSVPGQVVDSWNALEIPQTIAQANFSIGRRLSDRIEVQLGFSWASRGFADRQQIFGWPIPPPPPPPSISDDPFSTQAYHTYYSLEVPVKGRYFVKKGKLKLYVEGGIAPSWLYGAHTTRAFHFLFGPTEYHTSDLLTPDTRRFQLTASYGFGAVWQFSKRWGVYAGPSFEHQLMPIAVESPLNRQLYSWNMSFGLRYHFLRKHIKFLAMK